MHTALAMSAFALIALGASPAVTGPATAPAHVTAATFDAATFDAANLDAANFDPEPTDCPFCGGNAMLHAQRLFELERTAMALATSLLR